MDWIKMESVGLACPALADELTGSEALEWFEAAAEVVSGDIVTRSGQGLDPLWIILFRRRRSSASASARVASWVNIVSASGLSCRFHDIICITNLGSIKEISVT